MILYFVVLYDVIFRDAMRSNVIVSFAMSNRIIPKEFLVKCIIYIYVVGVMIF